MSRRLLVLVCALNLMVLPACDPLLPSTVSNRAQLPPVQKPTGTIRPVPSPPLPSTYQGIDLLLPVLPPDIPHLPPLWLLVDGQAILGTPIRYALSTGEAAGDEGPADLLQGLEPAAVRFSAGAPITILGPLSINELRARIVADPPLHGQTLQYLRGEGKVDRDLAVFSLETRGFQDGQYLRIQIAFAQQVSGNADYAWRLAPGDQRAPISDGGIPADGVSQPCALPAVEIIPEPTAASQEYDWWGPEAAAAGADLIIVGQVVGPPSGQISPFSSSGMIFTDTPVQVECSLKASAPSETILVRTEGGCVGETCMAVTHVGQIVVGERVILFLQYAGPESAVVRSVDGGFLTREGPDYYWLVGEDEVYTIAGHHATSGHFQFALDELIARIQSAIP